MGVYGRLRSSMAYRGNNTGLLMCDSALEFALEACTCEHCEAKVIVRYEIQTHIITFRSGGCVLGRT